MTDRDSHDPTTPTPAPAPAPKTVGGLSCFEVLDLLPDFVDGSLDGDALSHVHEHLAGCDWCERFGGQYAATVHGMRRHLSPRDGLDAESSQRLRRRLGEQIR
jgi:anti-sigma factor RsiW